MSDRDYKRTEPLVPEQDERIGHSEQPQAPVGKTLYREADSDNVKPSGGVGFLWKMLMLVLLLGIAGLGWLVYQQEQRQLILRQQFDDLQNQLSSTDESLSQSGAALSMKLKEHERQLKEHFAEIDKLWAARNANKKAIADLEGAGASLKKQLSAVSDQAKKAEGAVANASQAALAVRAELEEIEGLADGTLSRVEAMENALKQWQVEMNRRVSGNEEAIRAIDSFRRHTNGELQQLKQQLRDAGLAPAG